MNVKPKGQTEIEKPPARPKGQTEIEKQPARPKGQNEQDTPNLKKSFLQQFMAGDNEQ
jgi:hypothetical protein